MMWMAWCMVHARDCAYCVCMYVDYTWAYMPMHTCRRKDMCKFVIWVWAILWVCLHICTCVGVCVYVSVSVSAQNGIVALGKANTRSSPSLSSLPKVALETVPIFAWLNTDRSRPLRVECRPLPFSTPLSFRRSMLWCSGLSVLRKFLKPLSTSALFMCRHVYMCMNMIVSCMYICAHIAFVCTLWLCTALWGYR